jgi:hypothetical protein
VPPERLPLNWVPAGVITTETSGTLRGAGVEMDVTLCAGESSATATGQFLPTFSSAWNCALQVGDATHGGVAESVISTAGAPVTMSVIVTIPAPPATKIPLEASPGTSLMVIPSETLPETALVDVSAIVPFSYSVPDVQQPAPITHPTAGGPDHPVFIPGPLNSPDPNIRMAAVLAEQDDWDDRKRFPG